MKLQTILIILVVVVGVVGMSIYVSGESNNNENNSNVLDTPEVEYLTSKQTNQSDEFAKITNYKYGSLTINGLMNGDKAGQNLKVRDIKRNNSNVYVSLKSEDTDKLGATVITGYEYYLKLYNIEKDDNIYVSYGNNEYVLNVSNYENKDMNVSIELVESNEATNNRLEYEMVNGEIKVYGQMTANTGGHSLTINRTNFEDGKLEIYPDLQPPAGVATQAITTYEYEISVNDTDELNTIAVDNNNKMIEKKVDNISDDLRNITYKFEKQESEHYIGKVVEKDSERFVIEGEFMTGSSTCSYVELNEFEVDNNTVTVNLSAANDRDMNRECTDDISSSGYKLEVNDDGKIEDVQINIDTRFEDRKEKDLNVR